MTHVLHKPIRESGLADDCEGCKKLAEDPFAYLDYRNLVNLYEDTVLFMERGYFEEGLSENQKAAMRIMERHIIEKRRLDEAMRNLPATENEQ